jgi:hypothetical protein
MAKVGAQRAAVLTGRSKSTIQRAMNAGKLSYEQDANGRRIIDVSELERMFGIKPSKPQPIVPAVEAKSIAPNLDEVAQAVERERMAMTIKMLEQQLSTASEQLNDIRAQRDKWERQATQILITSQYSQRQAEELRSQIKDRDEKAKLRRLQYEERFGPIQNTAESKGKLLGNAARPAQAQEQNPQQKSQPSSPKPQVTNKSREAEKLDEQMKKLKAENQNARAQSNSVFRFWRKVTG